MKSTKSQQWHAVRQAIGIILVAISIVVIIGTSRYLARASQTFENLELFSEVLAKIQNVYVEPVTGKDLIEGAIKGMVSSLDPHSEYMPPAAFREMQVQTSGEFGGLGIEITMKGGVLTVVSPIEDTPAFRAGIAAGDQILAVNGESIDGMPLQKAVQKLRGKIGTKVTISVLRKGSPDPFDVTIKRDRIVVKSVKWHMEKGKIGYVKLTQFKSRTTEELRAALNKLMPEKPIGLILDLRNNPGGLLDQAVGVVDAFIKKGKIVYTDGRTPESHMEFFAHDDGDEPKVPLVVLVNGGSASASEIVAGALKDHRRALIVGTRTFGKGSVQSVLRLSNDGGLRITTALYYTPNGISIQGAGIEPDVKVEEFPGAGGIAYREENIKGHFKGVNEKNSKMLTPEDIKQRFEKKRELIRKFRLGELGDRQLERAEELLKSVSIFGPVLSHAAVTAPAGK